MFTKILAAAVLAVGGAALGTAIAGQVRSADCCATGAACCIPASGCCDTGDCCAAGAACCFPGSPCCEESAAAKVTTKVSAKASADCCIRGGGDDCCFPGSPCCTK